MNEIMNEPFLFAAQLLGSIAFAIAGALEAINKKMDLFGVVILGVVTAVGGGVIRDIILGIHPPLMFINPVYAIVSIITSLIIFIPKVRAFLNVNKKTFDSVLTFVDSIGLSIFCVVGIQTAQAMGHHYGVFLLCFVGLITGTGGSILRSMLVGETPFIFVKHFYACAAIIGSLVTIFLWNKINSSLAMTLGAAVIMILRILAVRYKWHLPKA